MTEEREEPIRSVPARSQVHAQMEAEHVDWPAVLAGLDQRWKPGEHVSIFGSTGSGKTYVIVNGLLPLWTRSTGLIVDAKRDRGTMGNTGRVVSQKPTSMDGLTFRVREWTRGKDHPSWDEDPEWYKLQPQDYGWSPSRADQHPGYVRARKAVGEALDWAFRRGNIVVVVDDVTTLADREPPGLDLGAPLRRMWRDGRDRGVTMIAATQAPSLAPPPMYDQPTFVVFSRQTDVRRQVRLGEIGGNRELIENTLPTLDRFEVLIGDLVYDEWIVTRVG